MIEKSKNENHIITTFLKNFGEFANKENDLSNVVAALLKTSDYFAQRFCNLFDISYSGKISVIREYSIQNIRPDLFLTIISDIEEKITLLIEVKNNANLSVDQINSYSTIPASHYGLLIRDRNRKKIEEMLKQQDKPWICQTWENFIKNLKDNLPVLLDNNEFELLSAFFDYSNILFSKELLYSTFWFKIDEIFKQKMLKKGAKLDSPNITDKRSLKAINDSKLNVFVQEECYLVTVNQKDIEIDQIQYNIKPNSHYLHFNIKDRIFEPNWELGISPRIFKIDLGWLQRGEGTQKILNKIKEDITFLEKISNIIGTDSNQIGYKSDYWTIWEHKYDAIDSIDGITLNKSVEIMINFLLLLIEKLFMIL